MLCNIYFTDQPKVPNISKGPIPQKTSHFTLSKILEFMTKLGHYLLTELLVLKKENIPN